MSKPIPSNKKNAEKAQAEHISVLLVEDHEATLKGLKSELSSEADIEVIGAVATSAEGLSLAQSLHPDIILLDLHLPDSAGPKSLTEAFCANQASRVIVFSGDSRTAILQIVLQAGVAGFLLKSEPLARVTDAIRCVMRGESVISSELNHSEAPKLTGAEQHLLTLLARGLKYQEIGAQRVTSPETVRKQVDALLTKLRLESREALIAWAVENGYSNLETQP